VLGERLGPDLHGPRDPLLQEHDLPVVVANGDEIADFRSVIEENAGASLVVTGEPRELVLPVEVDLLSGAT
jgi:hypothetical protein